MSNNNENKTDAQEELQHDRLSEGSKQNFSILGFIKKNSLLTSVLLGVLAVVIVFFWKDIEGERQKSAIIKVAASQIETNQQEMLKLLAKPLVWSIRSQMLRGNMEQVNILISDMVKEKNFIYIHLIEPTGNVILSTNKKLEGQAIGSEVDPGLLVVESPVVAMQADKKLVIAAPVMGVDRRLATLVFGYTPEEIKTE